MVSLGMMKDIRKMFIDHAKYMLENKERRYAFKKIVLQSAERLIKINFKKISLDF